MKEVHKVFHLSDIHIRLYHRLEDEYEHVFQQMYRLLEETPRGQNCLIVITGDILHNKNDLSPECIVATLRFLNKLSSYYPTLFIAGNHDTLLNNMNRMDSLSAILAENHNPQLHYLKYSGFYPYGDIVFGVSSLLDNQMTVLTDENRHPGKKHVALFHGGVGQYQTNMGFAMEGIPLSTFDGYDAVMLGDIHKHQYLDKNRRVAYAGSMIAQNFGETDPHHGVLVWDMATCGSTLHILPNPYRYCQAVLRDGVFWMDGGEHDIREVVLPERCRLRVVLHGQKTTEEIHQLGDLRQRHPHAQIQEQRALSSSVVPTETETEHGHHTPLSVIQAYFDTLPSSWKEKDTMRDMVAGYFVRGTQSRASSHFEILSLEFDYMFGYGPHNKIDFSQFQRHQTIGIFGMNSAGKSTLVEIVFFLLYGNITRYRHGQTVPPEVIHFRQKQSYGAIRFRSHNLVYEIQKTMTRKETSQKVQVVEKLFRYAPDGSRTDLSEEHRKKTDQFVISQIGTPTQFLFTNIFLQSHDPSFRSMTPKERKEFLYDLLDLSSLEGHYQHHSARYKENKQTLARLENELGPLHKVCPDTLGHARGVLGSLREERRSYEEQQQQAQAQIREKLSQKKYCPPFLETRDGLCQKIQHAQQEIGRWETKIMAMEQEEPTVQVGPGLLEKARNALRECSSRLQSAPQVGAALCFPPSHQKYALRPTLQDADDFRADVYGRFLEECHTRLQSPAQDTGALRNEKEQLLSSLYPGKDRPEDTATLEKMVAHHKTPLSVWKKKLASCEAERAQWKDQWQARWEEWERMPDGPDTGHLFSGFQFNEACGACMRNQGTLQTRLAGTEKLQQGKDALWQEIAPSYTKYKKLGDKVVKLRQKVVLLEGQEEIRNTLHNRSVRDRLLVVQKALQDAEEQHDYRDMKEAWEHVRQIAGERDRVVLHNQEIQRQVRQTEQEVAELETKRERSHQLRDLLHQARSQRKEWASQLGTLRETLSQQEQWEAHREHNLQIDQWVCEKEQEEQQLRTQLSRNMERMMASQQELTCLEQQFQEKQEKEQQYREASQENAFLQKLLSVLHRDGLPMYFLERCLPSIEAQINELIRPFLPEKHVVLRKEKKKESVDILLSVRTLGAETVYLGGMEGFIVDAAIKEVLAEVSSQGKSNLFLIDEGISALDRKQMEHLDQFFHFLEERHPHVFIISHLNQAQHLVRHSMHILKEGDYSKIVYE